MPVLASPKHELFAQGLAQGLTREVAYEAAGFKPHRQNAYRLAANEDVKARVAELFAPGAEKAAITAERVLAELAKIGFSDIRKLFTPGGNLLPIAELDDDTAASLSSIEVVTRKVPGGEEAEVEHVAKIKLWDKKGALVDIGKHLGMFKEALAPPGDVNVNLTIGDGDLARLIAFQLTKASKD